MPSLSSLTGNEIKSPSFFVGDSSHMAWFRKKKKRVHIFALGDVGGMLLTGLKLLDSNDISQIGVYDVRENVGERFAFEMNQILSPSDTSSTPEVIVLQEHELFSCDVFVFCASLRVPPLSETGGDVRMAQWEANAGLMRTTAANAVSAGFDGLFAVVSDPVDPLCKAAVQAGLRPEQVKGFGLGVMHARAAYYARQDSRFASYLSEGRAYGPHGQDLVIANSLFHYQPKLSEELTRLTVQANLVMREMGFKPYIAPALSSGAYSILAALRGEWHYSSTWMEGAFFGARNRCTADGIEVENPDLPTELYEKCLAAYENLKVIS